MFVTRIMIRAIGEEHWTEYASFRLMTMVERVLKANLAAGEFDFSKYDELQKVTDIRLYTIKLTSPKDAAKAKAEGYLREQNPFRPGTAGHARWTASACEPTSGISIDNLDDPHSR